jgi:hypothetical protein
MRIALLPLVIISCGKSAHVDEVAPVPTPTTTPVPTVNPEQEFPKQDPLDVEPPVVVIQKNKKG